MGEAAKACRPGNRGGAVAAGHETTAAAAAGVLEDGGNAFDATIAGLWAACVAEPVLASPAGGGFLMAQLAVGAGNPAGRTELFDFFVATPRRIAPDAEFNAITVDFGTASQVFHIGAGSAGVPGFVPGLYAVHGKLGSLPMARLLAPAIEAARDGVALTRFQAHLSSLVSPILLSEPGTAAHYTRDGVFPAPGARLYNPALAGTFETLAEEGLELFTHGEMAKAMAGACAGGRGHLTVEDFSHYNVAVRKPLQVGHGGWRLALNPPPAAGGALVGLTLQLVAKQTGNGRSVGEAMALALAEVAAVRNQDPDSIAARICRSYPATPQSPAAPGLIARRGTTHISVVDRDGNAAAATVSNGEGNGHLVGGFLINNVLGEEDVNPGGFGDWPPGVRLSSMMAPTIMTRGDEIVALGSGGSNRIRSAVALVSARIAAGDDLRQAIGGPRLHVEGEHLDFERGFDAKDTVSLGAAFANHRVWPEPNMFFGGVHAASRDADGRPNATADGRRDGATYLIP